MSIFIPLIFFLFLGKPGFSQCTFKIFLGGGFENTPVTLIGSYYVKDEYVQDTLLYKKPLTSNAVIGLATTVNARFAKHAPYALRLEIDNKTFLYRTDKLCRKSELRIENYDPVDFCFLYKGKFEFY